MRLETALLSGREGITCHGQAISVIGDNLANANTDGYKTSRTEFADMIGSGQSGDSGTSEPETGCGVSVVDIRQIFDQGTLESTSRSLDCGIDGEGFFQVGNAANPFYSRSGSFSVDAKGNLVSNENESILGYAPGSTTLGPLNISNVKTTGKTTSAVTIIGNVEATLPVTTVPTSLTSYSDVSKTASFTSSVDVYDSLGEAHAITLGYYKTGTNTWTVQGYIDGGDVGGTKGVPVSVGSCNLAFSSDGVIPDASKATASFTATPAYSDGAAAGNFKIDLSSFTQYASSSNISSVVQDGLAAGNISGYSIGANGELYATMDSGATELVGTIMLADFINKDGLERIGSTMYRATNDAGTATIGTPGVGSFGELKGGTLERSTVDLSDQFVNLVLMQRGYQANSQSLQTANELIRDTIQLMR